MQIRPTLVIPLKASGGTFWTILGVAFLAWILIRADPTYKSEEDAEREISLKFKRSTSRQLEPRPAPSTHVHPHPGADHFRVNHAMTTGFVTPVSLGNETDWQQPRPIRPIFEPVRDYAPADETGTTEG